MKIKIAVLINDISMEEENSTTLHICVEAHNRGHDVYLFGENDFVYREDERIYFYGRKATGKNFTNTPDYLKNLKEQKDSIQNLEKFDVLFLRNNPSEDITFRPWSKDVGIIFGRYAVKKGIIVLNDPDGLSIAQNKIYMETFPQKIRPKTVICRNKEEVKNFYEKMNRQIILKPVFGSQGMGVFFLQPEDIYNFNQIVNSVFKDGYAVAQEFLPEAKNGDIRVFTMNGVPLKRGNTYAAFHRVPTEWDIRANIHAGASFTEAKIDNKILKLINIIKPKLIQDGIFFAGIDIIGDKVIEVNVFSPGGFDKVKMLTGYDFSKEIVDAIENKVKYKKLYNNNFSNIELNTL